MGGVAAGHGPQKRTRSRITFKCFQELQRLVVIPRIPRIEQIHGQHHQRQLWHPYCEELVTRQPAKHTNHRPPPTRLDLGNCEGITGDVRKLSVLNNLRHLDLSKVSLRPPFQHNGTPRRPYPLRHRRNAPTTAIIPTNHATRQTRCTGELSSLALCSRLETISLADTAVMGSMQVN